MKGLIAPLSVLAVTAAAASLAVAATPSAAPHLSGAPMCPVFPAGNVWNQPVTGLPVAANSDAMVRAIGIDAPVHPDFASHTYGIPYNVVGKSTPKVHVRFQYSDESDHVGYPIPAHPRIEGGSDRHLLIVDRDSCRLYELFAAQRSGSGWQAGSGAVWNLRSNHLRPNSWTSADAAGLPILPGLARADEMATGAIRHALRFTAPRTRSAHIYPARHDAGDGSDPSLPPMGLRLRLKASVSLAGLGRQARIVAQAMKTYGIILADNGSAWYVQGAPDRRWNDDDLHSLSRLTGADFEVVDTSGLHSH